MNNVKLLINGRTKGLHIYISIDNLDEIIKDEERRFGEVKRSLKLLDSFFVSIRRQVSKQGAYPGMHIEKLTGNRMHLYIERENADQQTCMKELLRIAAFSYRTIAALNKNPKLESIKSAVIRIGADYGWFYCMSLKDIGRQIDEETSVGFAVNYACKLQIIARNGSLALSEDDYPFLPSTVKGDFVLSHDTKISKYHPDKSDRYYKASLSVLADRISKEGLLDFAEDDANDFANKLNLGEMRYRKALSRINLDAITEQESVKFYGAVIMADIRNFTGQFKDDDSNLAAMTQRARSALSAMIEAVLKNGGTHVQVQGDKEVAIFPADPSSKDGETLKAVVISALSMMDAVRKADLDLGVGISLGYAYASRIDTRGIKDPVILGSTVTEADELEDEQAKSGEIVISKDLYDALGCYEESRYLQKYFKQHNSCFVTSLGLKSIMDQEEVERLKKDELQRKYYGAYLR